MIAVKRAQRGINYHLYPAKNIVKMHSDRSSDAQSSCATVRFE